MKTRWNEEPQWLFNRNSHCINENYSLQVIKNGGKDEQTSENSDIQMLKRAVWN